MARILVADDEEGIRSFLRDYLEEEGHAVLEAEDGLAALEKILQLKPDLVLLKMLLPIHNGLEVCQRVRMQSDVPIIMTMLKDGEEDPLLGLEVGADDFITKPFDRRELMTRIKAALRSLTMQKNVCKLQKTRLDFSGLSMDTEDFRVILFGNKITLTSKEFALLWHLAASPNKIFSRAELLEKVWGSRGRSNLRTVDTHIKCLRHKLGIHPEYAWDIETVRNIGYKFTLRE